MQFPYMLSFQLNSSFSSEDYLWSFFEAYKAGGITPVKSQ